MSTNDEFLKYLNLARQYPAYFLPLLEKQINSFTNDKQIPLAEGVLYDTNEGKSAWIEAKLFLMSQKSMSPLIKHQGLCKSASQHRTDICQNGIFGHKGSDGSTFSQRILRFCKKGPGAMAEIIGADFDIKDRNTAQMTILSLIIDDGVKDRGHRKTIFSPTYKYVGWSTGKQEEKFVTIFNMTENNLESIFSVNNENSFSNSPGEKLFNQAKQSPHNGRHQSVTISPVKDITNNFSATTPEWKSNDYNPSTIIEGSKLGNRKGKKVSQKRQNTRTFYQDGAKVIETTVRFIYSDGTIEQNIDRRTIFIDE